MANPFSAPEERVNVVVSVINRLRLVGRLFMDPRIPVYLKLIPVGSIAYALMPFDVIPDVVPILGQLDDLGIILLAVEAFVMMAPQDIVREHIAHIQNPSTQHTARPDDTIVDGEWHTVRRDR